MKNWHLDKVGVVGSLLALLCCLGFGPLIALLSAIGAGFMVHDAVLAPLLVVFLVIGGIGLGVTYRRHRAIGPLVVYTSSATAILISNFVSFVAPLVWLGIFGLIAASVWDYFSGKRVH
ncbi:MAG: MerC domain-containing protein [Syntrophobacteraceae bacterium]